jgi:L-ascorbate metabolism protein UlaG (beta-lactamase superfamily)
MLIVALLVVLFISGVYIFMKQPQFGRLPSGESLERRKKSPHYREGKFQNINFTPDLAEDTNMFSVLVDVLFRRSKRNKPSEKLPSQKTDLLHLDPNKNLLVWFGHSSYFMQIDGKKFLVDPVFSGSASPLPNSVKSFAGSDVYTTDDFPEIDYLFISHDHWDHLDYKTIKKIHPKIKKIITALGVADHLERWGFDKNIIIEKDWNEEVILESGFIVNTTSGRHFSGRGFKRQQSLWMSFVLKTPTMKIFIGGDSGYDTHFTDIGNRYGPFDLAILECGQYNKNWKYIHMMPEETVQAAEDLKAKKLLPVHWAKFALALHDWDEPVKRVIKEAERKNFPIIHPMIGEAIDLNENKIFPRWWEDAQS